MIGWMYKKWIRREYAQLFGEWMNQWKDEWMNEWMNTL